MGIAAIKLGVSNGGGNGFGYSKVDEYIVATVVGNKCGYYHINQLAENVQFVENAFFHKYTNKWLK